jgi:predicted phage-related endonuclease
MTNSPTDAGAPADKGSVELAGMSHVIAALRECKDQLAHFTKLRRDLESMIKVRLAGAEIGTLADVPVVTYRTTLRVSVSQRELKSRYPAIALECQDITEVTTFKLLDVA